MRRQYKAGLTVINIGGTFTTGPVEAAYVVNELVKPRSVIASHANEPATQDGKLKPGSKTEAFRKAATMPVHLPLSGQTNGIRRCRRLHGGLLNARQEQGSP